MMIDNHMIKRRRRKNIIDKTREQFMKRDGDSKIFFNFFYHSCFSLFWVMSRCIFLLSIFYFLITFFFNLRIFMYYCSHQNSLVDKKLTANIGWSTMSWYPIMNRNDNR